MDQEQPAQLLAGARFLRVTATDAESGSRHNRAE
jgi:hypothetical protein